MTNFFEGWYFKHQVDNSTLAFIPGISNDNAFIQVITDTNSYNFQFDLSEFSKGRIIKIAGNSFSQEGLMLDIRNKETSIKAEICYKNITPIKSDIMGFFKYFPMECRHGILSLHHDISGYVGIDGEYIYLDNGIGYIEKDSGQSFPKAYAWVQSNDFPEKCCVMASIAEIPFMGFNFTGVICVVFYRGVEYRLATYNGAKIIACSEEKMIIERGKYRLDVEIEDGKKNKGHSLYAPNWGTMSRTIKENPSCKSKICFFDGKIKLFDFESKKTSFEYVY